MQTDALIHTAIKNLLDDANNLDALKLSYQIASDTYTGVKTALNELLDKTVIKRACCLGRQGPDDGSGKTGVWVRIPVPILGADSTITSDQKKYNYVDKVVYVPADLCDKNWTPGSKYCDNFMDFYCKNMLTGYKNERKAFDGLEWSKYKPECACYGEVPDPSFAALPRRCYMAGCDELNTQVYLDPRSRNKECTSTICTAINNFVNIKAGQNANISTQISQNCGRQKTEEPSGSSVPVPAAGFVINNYMIIAGFIILVVILLLK